MSGWVHALLELGFNFIPGVRDPNLGDQTAFRSGAQAKLPAVSGDDGGHQRGAETAASALETPGATMEWFDDLGDLVGAHGCARVGDEKDQFVPCVM